MSSQIKLVAFDLDGTLTQHKSKLNAENRSVLDELAKKYKLLIVGAGSCMRIFKQLDEYPIDIVGNYGMQFAEYDAATKQLVIKRDDTVDVNRNEIDKRAAMLRKKIGYEQYVGDSVEYHPSGMLTFPLLGTAAKLEDKLAFDPDRSKRKPLHEIVKKVFYDYTVFIGGSSSFDIVPLPYNKLYALDLFCKSHNLSHENVVYVGDDYGVGGNDEDIYKSDIKFICVDDYRKLRQAVQELL